MPDRCPEAAFRLRPHHRIEHGALRACACDRGTVVGGGASTPQQEARTTRRPPGALAAARVSLRGSSACCLSCGSSSPSARVSRALDSRVRIERACARVQLSEARRSARLGVFGRVALLQYDRDRERRLEPHMTRDDGQADVLRKEAILTRHASSSCESITPSHLEPVLVFRIDHAAVAACAVAARAVAAVNVTATALPGAVAAAGPAVRRAPPRRAVAVGRGEREPSRRRRAERARAVAVRQRSRC